MLLLLIQAYASLTKNASLQHLWTMSTRAKASDSELTALIWEIVCKDISSALDNKLTPINKLISEHGEKINSPEGFANNAETWFNSWRLLRMHWRKRTVIWNKRLGNWKITPANSVCRCLGWPTVSNLVIQKPLWINSQTIWEDTVGPLLLVSIAYCIGTPARACAMWSSGCTVLRLEWNYFDWQSRPITLNTISLIILSDTEEETLART